MMESRHLVDPELLPLLDQFPRLELTVAGLPDLRKTFDEQIEAMQVPAGMAVLVHEICVPGLRGQADVRVLCYRPEHAAGVLPALLHIHGGGYVVGTPEGSDLMNRSHALSLDCAIFSVDYRLAPEVPHPGPVEDCYAALHYLHAQAETLRIDRRRIGIKGESAGGGLAAALALLARDRGEVPVAFQHLIYPMLDDRTCRLAEPHPYTGEFIWTAAQNRFGWAALLGEPPGGPYVPPYAAAARATDLAGLPPCFMATGALDLFLEEDLDYARRLTRHGIPLELHVYPGAIHGFRMITSARISIAAERDSQAALRRALAGEAPGG